MNFDFRTSRIWCFRVALLLAISSEEARGAKSQKTPSEETAELPEFDLDAPALDAKLQNAYPYTVSLRRRSDLGYFCSGVLIGNRHVLTAAHCVDSSITSVDAWPQVVVGSASSSETSGAGVQMISTQNVLIHPGYGSMRFPDLAILELSSLANQTPVRIPTTTNFRPQHSQFLRSMGWGRRSSSAGNSEIIQVSTAEYIDPRICRARLGKVVFPYQIYMGGNGGGSCAGDDGGPIIVPGETRADDILVGIVGSFHVCGKSRRPDVQTKVAPYIHWIKSNAGILP